MKRLCARCPAELGRRNRSGLCRVCHNHDPSIIAHRGRSISAWRRRKLVEDPEFAARARDHGRWLGTTYDGNALMSTESRRLAGQKLSDRRLAWCPREHRDEYRRLTKSRGLKPEQAKAIILAHLAEMTPFERQLARVRNGASICVVRPMPSKSFDFSLTGCSL